MKSLIPKLGFLLGVMFITFIGNIIFLISKLKIQNYYSPCSEHLLGPPEILSQNWNQLNEKPSFVENFSQKPKKKKKKKNKIKNLELENPTPIEDWLPLHLYIPTLWIILTLARKICHPNDVRNSFNLSRASSYDAFSFWSPWSFDAFNQRSSKLVRMSYATGPSIRQCKSCHSSLVHPTGGSYFI